jgi:hypothetical protein
MERDRQPTGGAPGRADARAKAAARAAAQEDARGGGEARSLGAQPRVLQRASLTALALSPLSAGGARAEATQRRAARRAARRRRGRGGVASLRKFPGASPLRAQRAHCAPPLSRGALSASRVYCRSRSRQPELDALDDLQLGGSGIGEAAAESALLSLLQRLRFGGADAALGLELCQLALSGAEAAPEARAAEAAAAPPQAQQQAVSLPLPPPQPAAPPVDRAAARQRARFVRALVRDTLRAPQQGDSGE